MRASASSSDLTLFSPFSGARSSSRTKPPRIDTDTIGLPFAFSSCSMSAPNFRSASTASLSSPSAGFFSSAFSVFFSSLLLLPGDSSPRPTMKAASSAIGIR